MNKNVRKSCDDMNEFFEVSKRPIVYTTESETKFQKYFISISKNYKIKSIRNKLLEHCQRYKNQKKKNVLFASTFILSLSYEGRCLY